MGLQGLGLRGLGYELWAERTHRHMGPLLDAARQPSSVKMISRSSFVITKPWLAAVRVYCRVLASGHRTSVSADAQLQHGVRAILASGPQHMDASCPAITEVIQELLREERQAKRGRLVVEMNDESVLLETEPAALVVAGLLFFPDLLIPSP